MDRETVSIIGPAILPPPPVPEQLNLLDALDALHEENVELRSEILRLRNEVSDLRRDRFQPVTGTRGLVLRPRMAKARSGACSPTRAAFLADAERNARYAG